MEMGKIDPSEIRCVETWKWMHGRYVLVKVQTPEEAAEEDRLRNEKRRRTMEAKKRAREAAKAEAEATGEVITNE